MTLKTESGRDVPVGQNGAKSPAAYRGFGGQYIDGSWRPGRHGGVQVDTDPYSGATLAEMVMANQGDLDEAYHAAAKAQVSWAAQVPAERAAVMLRSASIMEARHGEIIDWLIRESGSTRVKAELEWQSVHAVTLEAASFPHRMEGRILPLDEAGKQSRAYRQPLGVIGVISPWNFPMYLSHRSVAGIVPLTSGFRHSWQQRSILCHGGLEYSRERFTAPGHRASCWPTPSRKPASMSP